MTTILIADDHAANLSLLSTLFEGDDTLLLEARDGREALALAQEQRPDLVVTDILMPHMNGVEFVQRLRSDPRLADVPVIFYTATYREREARALAQACGVQWVLGKPADPERILEMAGLALGRPLKRGEQAAVLPATGDAQHYGGIHAELIEYLSHLEITQAAMSDLIERGRALALDRTRLQEIGADMARSLHRLQAVSLRLTPLIELGLDLSSERDPRRLIEMLCRAAHNVCVCEFAVAGLIEPGTDRLAFTCSRGLSEEAPPWLLAAPARPGVLAGMLDERLPLRLNDLEGGPATLGFAEDHPPVHSFLAVPLATRERIFGWLYLVDKLAGDGFSEAEEQIATTIASQCAIAYENMMLYDEVRRLNEALEARVEERTSQLRSANTDLAAFNTSVSHDLRAPLRAICGFSEILQQKYAAQWPDDARNYLRHVVEAGRRMNNLIDDLLAYARLGSETLAMVPIALDDVVQRVIDSLAPQIVERGAQVVVEPGLLPVLGHPTLLQQMFTNLLDNAMKYRREGEVPRVIVGCTPDDDHVVVTVRDNGIGIAAEHRERVFAMFQRLQTPHKIPGTGVGLALVKKAVEKMGGEVWVHSVVGTGSIFSVKLPMAPAAQAA